MIVLVVNHDIMWYYMFSIVNPRLIDEIDIIWVYGRKGEIEYLEIIF